jgi:hypothetical protein
VNRLNMAVAARYVGYQVSRRVGPKRWMALAGVMKVLGGQGKGVPSST